MTLQQGLSFALILGAVVMFAWGRFRFDLVSLAILFLGVLVGVVKPKHVFDGFSNEIVAIIGSALVVSAAIAKSGVVEWVLGPLLPRLTTERLQVPVLVGATILLSMVTKNVGALAILMPVAMQLARKTGTSPARLLMPMSFGALLGGVVTLVGTSPNIIVSEVRQQAEGKPFTMFDFTPVGLGLALLGFVFLSFAYPLLPKSRKGATEMGASLEANSYSTEARAPNDWPAEGRTLSELKAMISGDAAIAAVLRPDGKARRTLPDSRVKPGDTLILEGEQQALDQLISAAKLRLAQTDRPVDKAEAKEEVRSIEAVIADGSVLIGRSAARVDLRDGFGVNLLAVSRRGERFTERLRTITLRAGDVLVLQAAEKSMSDVLQRLGCLPLAEREVRLGGVRRSLAPVLILAAAMLTVAFRLVPVQVAFFGAAVCIVAVGSLSMREAYSALDAPVLILIAALVPISDAVRATGGTELVAHALSHVFLGMQPYVAIALMMLTGMLCAPFLHNVPTVLILGPIAATLAKSVGVNPDTFLMAVATGAACDFLTPIGHQCNTLVWGPGGYKFTDYPRLGAPLSLAVIMVGTLLISIVWPLARH